MISSKSECSRNGELLPGAMIAENRINRFFSVLLPVLFFVLLFVWWLTPERELFRVEGLYAASAQEYRPGINVTAHAVVQRNVLPLYPAVTSLLHKCGIPMESSLRIVSVFMLGAWAVLAAFIAGKRRNFRAGVVCFCCCAGTVIAMDKGVDGTPAAMTAFFLFASQMAFFHYGSRFANWNKAWIFGALLLILAFFSGGPVVILYFALPILFLRRPLSVGSKFNTPGFFTGCFMVAAAVISWGISVGMSVNAEIISVEFSLWDYLKQILTFPLVSIVRMMPWSLLCWLPFCAALQPLDQTPVFSRYLRTLFFSNFMLLWLLPKRPGSELFLICGPLAVLTGLYYEYGIRRYWKWFRKALFAGEIFLFLLLTAIAALCFMPDAWLNAIPLVSAERWLFRRMPGVDLLAAGALTAVFLLTVFFHITRKGAPVWSLILMLSTGCMLFFNLIMFPNYYGETQWRTLGCEISGAVADEPVKELYKLDIEGMYCGLFYAGLPVKKIRSASELPPDETVYLVSVGFPRHFSGWRWSPLTQNLENFSIWKGVPIPPDDEPPAGEW